MNELAKESSFDITKHMINVQGGRQYLPVAARVMWFRKDHPNWGIVTDPVEINLEAGYAIFRTTLLDDERQIISTATKFCDRRGFADFIGKAESGSVGRALALAGYGTQDALDEEGDEPIQNTPKGNRVYNPESAPPRVTDAPMPNRGSLARPSVGNPPQVPTRPVQGPRDTVAVDYTSGGNVVVGRPKPAAETSDDFVLEDPFTKEG